MALTANEILYICNPAMVYLGVDLISGITDDSEQAETCDAVIDLIVKGILTDHIWNSLKKRAALPYLNYVVSGITQANPGVVTLTASHDFPDEATIILEDVVGMTEVNDLVLTVANGSGATFELSGVDTSAYTAYVSGGTARAKPLFGYDYWYKKPTDYLYLIETEDKVISTIEGDYLLTDERNESTDLLNIKYVKYDTDPANYGTKLNEVLKYRMAAEVSPKLTENDQKTATAWLMYEDALEKALVVGACEDKEASVEENTYKQDSWIPTF